MTVNSNTDITYNPSIYQAWKVQKRPVYARLPGTIEGSLNQQDAADWITDFIDSKLIDTLANLEGFKLNLDPDTSISNDWLNYLAQYCGFVGDYWDDKWTKEQKQWMIANSFKFIWPLKGTRQCLEAILNNFDLLYDVWTESRAQLPFKLPSQLGKPSAKFFVRVPLSIERDEYEWNLTKKLVRQYSLLGVKKGVCYETFALGYSRLGDPLFTPPVKTVLVYTEQTFKLGFNKIGDALFEVPNEGTVDLFKLGISEVGDKLYDIPTLVNRRNQGYFKLGISKLGDKLYTLPSLEDYIPDDVPRFRFGISQIGDKMYRSIPLSGEPFRLGISKLGDKLYTRQAIVASSGVGVPFRLGISKLGDKLYSFTPRGAGVIKRGIPLTNEFGTLLLDS